MAIKLLIPSLIKAQLEIYADAVKGEIGGLGRVHVNEDNNLLVTEVFLIEQTAHSAECDLDSAGIEKLYRELMEEDKEIDDIMFWWHSHGEIAVCFSPTDKDTIAEWPGDWLVSLVINKRGDLVAELSSFVPMHLVAKLDVEVTHDHPLKEQLVAEVKEKVQPSKLPEVKKHQKWMHPQRPKGKWDSALQRFVPFEEEEKESLLKDLFPEIVGKDYAKLTDEEIKTLDDIIDALPTDQQMAIYSEVYGAEEEEYDLAYMNDGWNGFYHGS